MTWYKKIKLIDCVIIVCAIFSAMLYPQRRSLRVLLMNETQTLNITSKLNTSFLIFNRNPKAASQTIWTLLNNLQYPNNFHSHHASPEFKNINQGENVYLTKVGQEEYVKLLKNDSIKTPFTYNKHINFINFEDFGYQNPIYINFVREPVEKVISWYYYKRQNWYQFENEDTLKDGLPYESPALLKMSFEDCVTQKLPECVFDIGSSIHWGPNGGNHISQISFFCGMDKVCDDFGSVEALKMAKRNVDRFYAVVGVVEKMQESLQVLENYVPAYFRHATKVYNEIMRQKHVNHNNGKPKVPNDVKELLRRNFTTEIDFYQFCKQRLKKQYLAINKL